VDLPGPPGGLRFSFPVVHPAFGEFHGRVGDFLPPLVGVHAWCVDADAPRGDFPEPPVNPAPPRVEPAVEGRVRCLQRAASYPHATSPQRRGEDTAPYQRCRFPRHFGFPINPQLTPLMAKQFWFPRKESDRRTLLNNLADKLPGDYATKYGITAAELDTLETFRKWFNWTLDALEYIRQKALGYTGFRDALGYGKGTATGALTQPTGFALAPQPTGGNPPAALVPQANGWKFVASLVNRIKGHAAYAVADGQDLAIEGAQESVADPETTKPVIEVVRVAGGKVEVRWKKGGFTGVRIEVDRGNSQWAFLAVDTMPDYLDTVTAAAGTTALWKYRAIYLDGDEPFGQWSDPVSIAVTG